MRTSVLVALLASSAALLAGCADDDGHGAHTYTCPDGSVLDLEQFPDHDNETFDPLGKCGGKGSSTNSTSLAPNVLPSLTLKVSDDGGNETRVTFVDGNLTFDATGSKDPDGSITGIAVSVTDSNTTRTATLYDAATKAFKAATFKFDRPGVVNVTVAMVDDRAGFTVNQSKVYVNHVQQLAAQTIALPGGSDVAGPCTGNNALVDSFYMKPFSFSLVAGATQVEATETTTGNTAVFPASITICSPAGESLSDTASGTVVTNPDADLTPPTGTESYQVVAMANAPESEVAITVVVHYEPQEDAAA